MNVLEIVADVARRLREANIPYLVGGSMASSAWGHARQTNDADVVLLLDPERAEDLLSAFGDPYYISALEVEECLESDEPFRSVQLMHMDEVFKLDLFLATPSEYIEEQLTRSVEIELLPGAPVRYAAAEDIVLAKLRWYELGNRVSDRQWNDIVQVLEIQKGRLDEAYLNRWADHFGVRELLDEARGQTID